MVKAGIHKMQLDNISSIFIHPRISARAHDNYNQIPADSNPSVMGGAIFDKAWWIWVFPPVLPEFEAF
jgi:hypothetical protein